MFASQAVLEPASAAQGRCVVDTSEVKRALDVDPERCRNLCTDRPSRRIPQSIGDGCRVAERGNDRCDEPEAAFRVIAD